MSSQPIGSVCGPSLIASVQLTKKKNDGGELQLLMHSLEIFISLYFLITTNILA
jgi:hypothetical protein